MNGRITIIINTPEFKEIKASYNISEYDWMEFGFDPLPRNHDAPLEAHLRSIADKQRVSRYQSVRRISQRLAEYIFHALQGQDPRDGLYPSERFNQAVSPRGIDWNLALGGFPQDDDENKRIPMSAMKPRFEWDRVDLEDFLDDSEEGKAGDQGE